MAGKSHPHVKMAEDYAKQVLAGKIDACLYVRQACERQLRDRERKNWPYRFDSDAAERVCRFAELLPHIKGPKAGQRIRLVPWQAFILTTAFGWVRIDIGRRRFRRVYVEVPRGNGKTTMSDAPALYMLSADGEGGAEVYSAARTRDQAPGGHRTSSGASAWRCWRIGSCSPDLPAITRPSQPMPTAWRAR